MKLVPGERERVDVEFAHIDGDVAHGLHRVGVEGRAVRVGDGGELANWFDGADLVVGEHDRNECRRGVRAGCCFSRVMICKRAFKLGGVNAALGVVDGADLVVGEHDRNECRRGVRAGCCFSRVMICKRAFKLGGVNAALGVDRQICDANAFGLEGLTAVQDGVVLDCAGHDVGDGAVAIRVAEAVHGSAQDPVVGFRPAAGEVNLVGMLGAKETGHGAACLSERDGSFARHAVDSARVAERVGEMGRHGLERARRKRRGGRVVGIDVGHDVGHGRWSNLLAQDEEPEQGEGDRGDDHDSEGDQRRGGRVVGIDVGHDVGHGRWSNLLAQDEEPEQGEGDRGDDHDSEGDLDSPALTVLAGSEDGAAFFGR